MVFISKLLSNYFVLAAHCVYNVERNKNEDTTIDVPEEELLAVSGLHELGQWFRPVQIHKVNKSFVFLYILFLLYEIKNLQIQQKILHPSWKDCVHKRITGCESDLAILMFMEPWFLKTTIP